MKIISICGSLNKESINLALLEEIQKYIEIDLQIIDQNLLNLPFFGVENLQNQELLHQLTVSKRMLFRSDMIMIGSPEYNGSLPAVMKNFIDWLSVAIKNEFTHNPFYNKKVALVSASPSPFGGLRGVMHMRDIMLQLGAHLIPYSLCISTHQHSMHSPENLTLIKTFSKNIKSFLLAGNAKQE